VGLIWRIGLINCHISNRDNLEKFLVAVSLMKLDICAVVESWFKGGGGGENGGEASRNRLGVDGERQRREEGRGSRVLGEKGGGSESSENE